jgi:excinuclease ABC subunit C
MQRENPCARHAERQGAASSGRLEEVVCMPSSSSIQFAKELAFDAANAAMTLAHLPTTAAVFSLRGTQGEPYLNRTPNLRRRLTRLLTPSLEQTKRLQLAGLVRSIAWTETASEFSAQWLLYCASVAAFGDHAAKRLHLRAPHFLRMGMRNRYPRMWVTNSITSSAMDDFFGPWPSRNAAERYAEEALDLFLLRRCFPDLEPDPEFPGCIYSEMKKCLAPCFGGCSVERYAEEAAVVHEFFATGGQTLLASIARERDQASGGLDFEAAAAAHARHGKVASVTATVPDIARTLASQHAVLVQPSPVPDEVELYLLQRGTFSGPALFSVLGMRLPNEQSGSSSLFAHPAAPVAMPIGPETEAARTPDQRLQQALETLRATHVPATKQELSDHQSLLARWYFRPQAKREGELVLIVDEESATNSIPRTGKLVLRAIARVYRAQLERLAPHTAAEKDIRRDEKQAIAETLQE